MKEIEVGDIVLVRESADSRHRLQQCTVLCEGPLIHVDLRTERTWILKRNNTSFGYAIWEPESNLVRMDFD